MWLLVLFDLPVKSKKERKLATQMRTKLLQDGFQMFQFSIYMRHCASRENADVHEKRVSKLIPALGKVAILRVTDQQFGLMKVFYAEKKIPNPKAGIQLEMF